MPSPFLISLTYNEKQRVKEGKVSVFLKSLGTPTRRKVRENAICCRGGVNVPKELPREAFVRLIQ